MLAHTLGPYLAKMLNKGWCCVGEQSAVAAADDVEGNKDLGAEVRRAIRFDV